MLQVAATILGGDRAPEAVALLNGIKGIHIRSFEFTRDDA
jgi:hypothetical protein